jgi:multicomponent Na+:H+ antiporter subunit D
MPPFGTFLGKSWIEESMSSSGYHWIVPLIIITSALTGATVLRVAGRVFLGLGPIAGQEAGGPTEAERPETEHEHHRTPWVMLFPAVLLLAGAIIMPYIPHLKREAEYSAMIFQDRASYSHAVLTGAKQEQKGTESIPEKKELFLNGLISAAIALIIAALGLFQNRIPEGVRSGYSLVSRPTVKVLRDWHNSHVGEYVMWVVIGSAILGIALVLAVR